MLHRPLRAAYRVAHRLMKARAFVVRPKTHGALCAARCEGRILVLQTTYRDAVSLPGGYVKPGENVQAAAARELHEEVGIRVAPESLTPAYHGTKLYEYREDTVDIVTVELARRPPLQLRRHEVEWAAWRTPEEILALPNVVPHLREWLETTPSPR